MFDVGFGELLVVALLGLIVLGPDKLPDAIRHLSLWVGRLKRTYRQVRLEIEKEIGADEIRRQLHNEEVMQSLNASKDEMRNLSQQFSNTLNTSIETPSSSDNDDKR